MKIEVNTYANIWVREIYLQNIGDKKVGHRHSFDHVHFVSRGRVRMDITDRFGNQKSIESVAPAWVEVPKEQLHSVVALEKNCLCYCIQSLSNKKNITVEEESV